jgi:hypothetical protein
MRTSFLIVDDFYDEPDSVRERALSLEFQPVPDTVYPGLTASTWQDVVPILRRVSDLLGGIGLAWYPPQGDFRITLRAHELGRMSMVHLDSSDLSGVVHLSQTPMEGTYVYRHKRLGLEYVPRELEQRADIIEALVRDTLDPDAWEVVQEIPMKYNRLLLFDGKHFHSGARRFVGEHLQEGRLTQNFFINRANP